ncbi:MAG TPA: AI-2E family transporter, partial [Arthrobacter sp.]
QPVVMGQALNVHALVILLALTAGTILAGIIGAILAVPLVAVGWAAIKAWNSADNITPEAIAEAEHETRLNARGEGVRSQPHRARTQPESQSAAQNEAQSETAASDASRG